MNARRGPVLVTGANGFVGTALCAALSARGIAVSGAVRTGARMGQVAIGDLSDTTDWHAALAGCRAVVHLAARVHVMSDASADPMVAYRAINVDATLNLARQAHRLGVQRFVFASSVKVNGEATVPGQRFSAADTPAPIDPYGQSKREAEAALLALGRETGLEVVIVRPPLVYGPGVKANFRNLVKLVAKGLPLPFGSARGLRSMVALDNLVDLLILCTHHPAAVGRIWMVSDGVDVTLAELVTMIATGMNSRARLIRFPVPIMQKCATVLGKAALTDRLFGSLQVDIGPTQAALGWTPPVTPQAAIDKTVAEFLHAERMA